MKSPAHPYVEITVRYFTVALEGTGTLVFGYLCLGAGLEISQSRG